MLFNNGSWGKVMRAKYLEDRVLEAWIRQSDKSFRGGSNVWKRLIKAFEIARPWVAWNIGKGTLVKIGEDLWIGCEFNYKISHPLSLFLHNNGITTLVDALGAVMHRACIQV